METTWPRGITLFIELVIQLSDDNYRPSAIRWVICLSRNDIIFNKARVYSSLHVVFRGTC